MGSNRVSAWLAVVLCAFLAHPVTAFASPTDAWGLKQLMHDLAQVKSASASFTEHKTMHMLKTPLVATGTLKYVAPDRLEKITVTPTPGSFVLDGKRVTMTSGPDHQTHTFSLDQAPQIAGLVDGIRATLAGNLPLLKHFYTVRLDGDEVHWQLTLKPAQERLARLVSEIRIRGSGDRVTTIDTESANGDRSEMSIVEDVVDAR